jgi:hypothetical protein
MTLSIFKDLHFQFRGKQKKMKHYQLFENQKATSDLVHHYLILILQFQCYNLNQLFIFTLRM